MASEVYGRNTTREKFLSPLRLAHVYAPSANSVLELRPWIMYPQHFLISDNTQRAAIAAQILVALATVPTRYLVRRRAR